MRAHSLLCVALAAVALLVQGCPRSACPTTPHVDARRALRFHRSLHRTVRALRAEARVEQRGENGRIRGTVMLMLARPDRVRFDALTQLGPAAVLTSDGEDFQLLDMRENRFFEGPTCPMNIERLLGVALSGAELARFLLGDSPRLETDAVAIGCGREGYVVTLTAPDGRRQELAFAVREGDESAPPDEQHLRLVRSELFHADGRTDWRATFERHTLVRDPNDPEGRGVAIPYRVRFVDPDTGADTEVRLKTVELLEAPPDAAVFRQTPPPGITVEPVLCE
ncbi:MAG: DUF4292 domain-containing protein [Myxococcales bacterium]|nr:DUF4292 domain-containing protein [Myxococcales bacterium]